MNLIQYKISSKIGPLYLVASEKGLRRVFWKPDSTPMIKNLTGSKPEVRLLTNAAKQIEEYLNGERIHFDLPLEIIGTDFQKKVWKQLSKLKYGKLSTYSKIAEKINNKKASRAVGTAIGKNPLCIIIPCHRIIASDGSIGGFSGGLSKKSQLIQLEQTTSIDQ